MFSPVAYSYTYVMRDPYERYQPKKGTINSGRFEEVESPKVKDDYKYFKYVYSFGITLNTMSKFPIVGVFSGPLRSALGLLDVITGVVLGIFSNTEYFNLIPIGIGHAIRGGFETAIGVVSFIAFGIPSTEHLIIYGLGVTTLLVFDNAINQTNPKDKIVYQD